MAGNLAGREQGTGRFAQGNKHGRKFPEGHKLSVGNAGGAPSSEVRAQLRQDGLDALPRIRAIAADSEHRDHYKANTWLAERGLREEIEHKGTEASPQGLTLPQWGVTENVS